LICLESLQIIEKLEIETNNMFYDKNSKILSIFLGDIVFIGTYKKSTRLSKILDDLFNLLKGGQLTRENIFIVDFVTRTRFPEKTKIKSLNLLSSKEKERPEPEKEKREKKQQVIQLKEKKKEDKKKAPSKSKRKKARPVIAEEKAEMLYSMVEDADDYSEEEEEVRDEAEYYGAGDEFTEPEEARDARSRGAVFERITPSAPKPAFGGPSSVPASIKKMEDEEFPEELGEEEPKPTEYEINMGLQYYPVMMEQMSYLFYVYFSHKKLKIVDEEGKTIFETSFKITTTKKEPPVLDLKVEGEGFDVHPLFGKVEVRKDAVNPPVMIFSILPIKKKKKTKKEKKEGERRHLHVYVEFENKVINHTVLSIVVQRKHFHLDLGPFHLNVSKQLAAIISIISILIAIGSFIFMIFSLDASSILIDAITAFAPGLGSIVFVIVFLVTLFKEGIYPLKEKIESFLNFDKSGQLIK